MGHQPAEYASGGPESLVQRLARRAADLAELERWTDAERHYREIVRIMPEEGSAFHNLGVMLRRQGRVQEAAQAHWNAAVRCPDRAEFWVAFSELFRMLRFEAHDPVLEEMVVTCLGHPRLNPMPLGKVALSVARAHPVLGPWVRGVDPESSTAKRKNTDAVTAHDLAVLAAEPLLLAMLSNTIVPSLEFEVLVESVRRGLLAESEVMEPNGPAAPIVDLAAAVALYCDLTGYIHPRAEGEAARLPGLRASVEAGFHAGDEHADGRQGASWFFRLAVLGCYEPLPDLAHLDHGIDELLAGQGPLICEMWLRLVREPMLRSALAEAVPTLSPPNGSVSRAVACQYEEHPYPRWLRIDDVTPEPAARALARFVPGLSSREAAPFVAPDVLVAGCGTGKQTLDLTRRFADARVTGIDLSRSSLGYAASGALRYDEERISFLHADLLTLNDWDARFDIVEAGGVLHHLEDPVAGWRVLVGLLRPGGLMKIGLYSRAARTAVHTAREALGWTSDPGSSGSIRHARQRLLDATPAGALNRILSWRDFYSLHECRDLLFHVEEHCFTLGQIDGILGDLGLDFLGFEILEPAVEARFLREEGRDRLLDLDRWSAFEQRCPDAFSSMYQFWVRGPGA